MNEGQVPVNERHEGENYFNREYFELHAGKSKYLQALVKLIGRTDPPDGPVLDLGSGFGFLVESLRDADKQALGLEQSIFACMQGMHRARTPVIRGSAALPFPFADESFSVVTLFDVIEHLDEYQLALGECFRVLKTGGVTIVSTNNRISAARPLLGREWSWYKDPTHCQLFGPNSLRAALRDARFARVQVRTYFNFCSVGESTPFLKPLQRIGRLVYVPYFGDAVLAIARK